jgi:hypothetical protein
MARHSTRDQSRPVMKAAFLDYDTVSNGDLDISAVSAAVDELRLFGSNDSETAARPREVEVVLLNKVELSRKLLLGAPHPRTRRPHFRRGRLGRTGRRRGQSPVPDRVPLDDLLAMADIVSLHCPLNDSTRGMMGSREFALMKPDALLINTARGGLLDGHALAAALKAGRLGGAGIDVLPNEPPLDGDPLLDLAIPNLILTPHVAWAAREARQRCLDEMAANIKDFREGGRRSRVV